MTVRRPTAALAAAVLLALLSHTAQAQPGSPPAPAPSTPLLSAPLQDNMAGPAQPAGGAVRQGAGEAAPGSQVMISELVSDNKNGLRDEQGDTPAWVELFNSGSSPVSLQGYRLTDSPDASGAWTFPAVTIGPGQYLILYLDGKNIADPAKPLHTSFKLSKDGDYLALLNPSGAVSSAVSYPRLGADVSFGAVGGAGVVSAQQDRSSPTYAVLASPTASSANSGPRAGGPLVLKTTKSANPRPNGSGDITVTTVAQPQQNPVASVTLVYLLGYGAETAVPMREGIDGTCTATIPQAEATPGTLIRWYIQATDSQGTTTRDPPYATPKDRRYYGTIVADPADSSSLFVLELYCPLATAPVNETATPGCSMLINGTYYDNLEVSRRGVTSLQWPKPKIKIESKEGQVVKVLQGWHKVSELNLNGEWSEPGENTFMREPLVWKTFREAGVEAARSFHTHVRMNGKYYGRFAFTEQFDKDTLKGWGYDTSPAGLGPLWKSTSGEYSNLRWDVPPEHIQYYWKKYTRKNASDDQALLDFAKGLSGGGSVVRSKYLFDAVNLPQVINHMAAQTMILNQDRCTKNFYIYLDLSTQQWSMIPWDVESGFASDRGLGGQPAPDYCILACEQWNSPLYCDRSHPQESHRGEQGVDDLAVRTPWGLISAQYPSYFTGKRRLQSSGGAGGDLLLRAARRMLQEGQGAGAVQGEGNAGAPANGAAEPGLQLPPNSTITPDFDVDQAKKGNRRMLRGVASPAPTPPSSPTPGSSSSSSASTPAASPGAGVARQPSLHGLAASGFLDALGHMNGSEVPAAEPHAPGGGSPAPGAPSPAPAAEPAPGAPNANAPPPPAPASPTPPAAPGPSARAALTPNTTAPAVVLGVADLADANLLLLGPTTTGSPGTYNYLIDAILAVPRTRQMYMRRLRTLMDQFIASGRLQGIVTEMYQQIHDEAKRDAAKWNNPGDVDRGYQQLIQEQLPIRKDQLYNTYGPKGAIPLIPDAQPLSPPLRLGSLQSGSGAFVEVVNPNAFAVDISGYALGGAVQFTFRPGTVIPAQDSVFVTDDLLAFKRRPAPPTGGEGRFVCGPFQGALLGPGASVTLTNAQGTMVAST